MSFRWLRNGAAPPSQTRSSECELVLDGNLTDLTRYATNSIDPSCRCLFELVGQNYGPLSISDPFDLFAAMEASGYSAYDAEVKLSAPEGAYSLYLPINSPKASGAPSPTPARNSAYSLYQQYTLVGAAELGENKRAPSLKPKVAVDSGAEDLKVEGEEFQWNRDFQKALSLPLATTGSQRLYLWTRQPHSALQTRRFTAPGRSASWWSGSRRLRRRLA
jgi:hypothetical protein